MSIFAVANVLQNARDGITKALTFVDYNHHEIHSGSHYYVEGRATLTDTQQLTVKFAPPASGKQAHFVWDIYAEGQVEIALYEDAAGGMAGGTTMTPLNNDRNSSKGSSTVFVSGVTTSTAVGAKLHDWVIGTTAKANIQADPGSASRENEIILKSGSTYLGMIASNVDGNDISFRAEWYEHTPDAGPKVAD